MPCPPVNGSGRVTNGPATPTTPPPLTTFKKTHPNRRRRPQLLLAVSLRPPVTVSRGRCRRTRHSSPPFPPACLPDRRRKQRLPRAYTDAYVLPRRPSNPSPGAPVLSPDLCAVRACVCPPLRASLLNGRACPTSANDTVPARLPCAFLRTLLSTPSPHRPLHPKTRIVTDSAQKTHGRTPSRLAATTPTVQPRDGLVSCRTARTTPPLHLALRFKTPMRCVHSVVLVPASRKQPSLRHLLCNSARPHCAGCASCVAPFARLPCSSPVTPPRRALRLCSRLFRTETAFGRPPQHAATSSPSQPHDGPVSGSDGSNYASASPSPVFQNAYALRILRFPPRRVPLVVLPPASCGELERTGSSDTTTVPLQNGPFASPRAPTPSSYAPRALHSRRCGLRLPFTALCASNHVLPLARVCYNRDGLNYASASPFPVFQNAYALFTHCFAPCSPANPILPVRLPPGTRFPAFRRAPGSATPPLHEPPAVCACRPADGASHYCLPNRVRLCVSRCVPPVVYHGRPEPPTRHQNPPPNACLRSSFGRPTTLPKTRWTDIGTRTPAPPRVSGPPLLLTGRSPPMPIRR